MSLNNIQLQSNLLTDLYKNCLVETAINAIAAKRQAKYLGNNQKKIIVVVWHSSLPFLPDKELDFLTTILAACKLGIADIGIINYGNCEQEELQIIIDEEANSVLLFGIEPLSIGLPINFPVFQLQAFNNRTYLHAPPLSQIEYDKGLKSRLWTSLKALFRI